MLGRVFIRKMSNQIPKLKKDWFNPLKDYPGETKMKYGFGIATVGILADCYNNKIAAENKVEKHSNVGCFTTLIALYIIFV